MSLEPSYTNVEAVKSRCSKGIDATLSYLSCNAVYQDAIDRTDYGTARRNLPVRMFVAPSDAAVLHLAIGRAIGYFK